MRATWPGAGMVATGHHTFPEGRSTVVHPKATMDMLAAAEKLNFEAEDARKVSYIADQLSRGIGKDKRPIREEADVRALTNTLAQLIQRYNQSQRKRG